MKTNKNLKGEKFREVYTWTDKPGKVYKTHSHRWETRLVILTGTMKLKVSRKWKNLKRGDSILIKQNQIHEAIVGTKGCKYLVGEGKIK